MGTTVAVTNETHALLKRVGHKGETFDQVIMRLYGLARRQLFYEAQKGILENEEFVPLD